MGNARRKLARRLVVFGLIIIGAWNVPEQSSTLEQSWRGVIPWPWLQANWIALACFALAAALIAAEATAWVLGRRHARALQREIRRNPEPGLFRETDACEALRYLLKESVWGWRAYARLNSWEMADGLQLSEFERVGLLGEILVTGFGSVEGKTVVIERRLWNSLRIDPATARSPNAVVARIHGRHWSSPIEFSDLAVAAADLEQAWPRASALRRLWSLFWVWLKKRFWFGSKLSNWLDERRRRSKQPQSN